MSKKLIFIACFLLILPYAISYIYSESYTVGSDIITSTGSTFNATSIQGREIFNYIAADFFSNSFLGITGAFADVPFQNITVQEEEEDDNGDDPEGDGPGGGSPGGGPGGGVVANTTVEKETVTIRDIRAGNLVRINFSKTIDYIEFKLKSYKTYITLSLEEYEIQPEEINVTFPKNITPIRFFKIDKYGFTDTDTDEIKISIVIDESILPSDTNKENVMMLKLFDEWKILNTTFIQENNNQLDYIIISQDLSYFALGLKKQLLVEKNITVTENITLSKNTSENTTNQPEIKEESKNLVVFFIILAIIIVLNTLIVFFYMQRRKEKDLEEIINWKEKAVDSGEDIEKVKNKLEKQGWSKEVIELPPNKLEQVVKIVQKAIESNNKSEVKITLLEKGWTKEFTDELLKNK